MTAPGAPGTASDGYRTEPAPHTCPAGPDDYGRRPCPCRTTTSLRPVDSGGRRRGTEDRVRELVKAGALIAAEIDRLRRALGGESRG